MNVSNQRLRRRQSLTAPRARNRTLRRAPAFKKRSKPSLDLKSAPSNDTNPQNQNKLKHTNNAAIHSTNILQGVVACLSGHTEEIKDRIHNFITKSGGTTMGNFDPSHVTHLILDSTVGSKYEHWKRHSNHDWAEKLVVVTSLWIEVCEQEGERVLEEKYKLEENANDGKAVVVASSAHPSSGAGGFDKSAAISAAAHNESKKKTQHTLPEEIQHATLEEKCNWMIQQPVKYPNLFSRQSFLLVGFEGANDSASESGDRDVLVDNSRLPCKGDVPNDFSSRLKGKVSKLIRRAGGTIYWEPNEWITTVILIDHSKHAWDDVRYFCREHPKGPICVSVDWILTSIHHQTLVAPLFPPEPQAQQLKRQSGGVGSDNTASVAQKMKLNKKPKQASSSLFRGDVFATVALKSLPAGTLEFNWEEMESTIMSNGGLLLSKSLLLAIRKDTSTTAGKFNSERKYYAVASTSFQLDCASPYLLLAELSKLGINIVPVSPVWVAACIQNDCIYDPEEYPLLFQPQTWAIRLFKPLSEKSNTRILISVTGFVDSSRYGIMSMLHKIGADFTDNLSRKNTHLICKQAQGQKYIKALEWGLHAVSIEWLYHIVQYGFKEGSEDRFSLATRKEPVSIHMPDIFFKEKQANPQLKIEADALFNSGGSKDEASRPVGLNALCEENYDGNQVEEHTKDSPCSHSASSRRGKRDPPQSSPNGRDPHRLLPKSDPSKRLHSALQALEAPAHSMNSTSMSRSPSRRSKRERFPMKASQESTSLLSWHSGGEDSPQMETQYTTGTILANADIGSFNGRHCSGDSSEVPLSQVNDAEDNGESQVVWFAPRG